MFEGLVEMKNKIRKEHDIFGEVAVPENAYWGAATQRAIQNFQISGRKFPEPLIRALAEVKKKHASKQTSN